MTRDGLDKAGIAVDELKKIAIHNLVNLPLEVKIYGDSEILMVTAGGDFEASLILDRQIWEQERVKALGDVAFAIPARDVLLIAKGDSKEAINKLKGLVEKLGKDSPYRLTNKLFRYKDGVIEDY